MPDVVCAGHICLDIAPALGADALAFEPGKLLEVGRASLSTGGSVANTGIALHKLGVDVRLMGKIGDDLFGKAVQSLVEEIDPSLSEGMIVVSGEDTSYSLVLNVFGADRMFLHCPGANDTFSSDDVPYDALAQAKIFHFGYPPLMARMYADDGAELAEMFRRAKETGVTTCLDMSLPDPNSPSGRADWMKILLRTLPYVDIFMPSFDELAYMTNKDDSIQAPSRTSPGFDVAWTAIPMIYGVKMLLIKDGPRGVFLRTAKDLSDFGRGAPPHLDVWSNRKVHAPAFSVDVVSSTGAGDATIAGFLMALLLDFPPDLTATCAAAVGATSCEGLDAHSALESWDRIGKRIDEGWKPIR